MTERPEHTLSRYAAGGSPARGASTRRPAPLSSGEGDHEHHSSPRRGRRGRARRRPRVGSGELRTAYDPQPVKSGAGWLTDQLTDGLVNNEQYQFDDYGLSIDVALGLQAAGKKPTVVKEVTKAVGEERRVLHELRPNIYAGPTAKAAVLAQARARTRIPSAAQPGRPARGPRGLRRTDLRPHRGRLRPDGQFGGDFANVIGQAYAVQALALAGSAKAAPRVRSCSRSSARRGTSASTSPPTRPGPTSRARAPGRGARRQHRRDRAGGPGAAGRQGTQGQVAVKKAVAGSINSSPRRLVRRHRQGQGRGEDQQHRPGRLGARRGRSHQGAGSPRRRGALPRSSPTRAPTSWRGDGRHRLRRGRYGRQATGIKKKTRTSGGGRPPGAARAPLGAPGRG